MRRVGPVVRARCVWEVGVCRMTRPLGESVGSTIHFKVIFTVVLLFWYRRGAVRIQASSSHAVVRIDKWRRAQNVAIRSLCRGIGVITQCTVLITAVGVKARSLAVVFEIGWLWDRLRREYLRGRSCWMRAIGRGREEYRRSAACPLEDDVLFRHKRARNKHGRLHDRGHCRQGRG